MILAAGLIAFILIEYDDFKARRAIKKCNRYWEDKTKNR